MLKIDNLYPINSNELDNLRIYETYPIQFDKTRLLITVYHLLKRHNDKLFITKKNIIESNKLHYM